MRRSAVVVALALGMWQASPALAQAPAPAPYAGQQLRDIKALSAEDALAYTEGRGMGFAKAAELNGYPGPMHVVELAEPLKLSAGQIEASRALLLRHKTEVRGLGQRVIDAERALDQAFAQRRVDADSLHRLLRDVALAQAEVRESHLRTHLEQTALLTSAQVHRYDELRGYAGAALDKRPAPAHTHSH